MDVDHMAVLVVLTAQAPLDLQGRKDKSTQLE